MEIIRTRDFEKSLQKLSREIRQLYSIQERRFQKNPRDSRLHMKKVKGLASMFSFRITRRYRVFFYFHTEEQAVFFEIDHRKDAYR